MWRILVAGAAILLFAASASAAGPQQEAAPRFQPVQVVSAASAVYPITSVGSGTLVLRVTVAGSGKIKNVTVVYGIASLTQGAENAVRRWRFKPALLDGAPVTSSMIAAFTYGMWPFANAFGAASTPEQSGGDAVSVFTPLRIIAQTAPSYPFDSVAAGTVALQVTIDRAGAIQNIKVLHDIPSLTEPAESAVRRWKFKPATFDGKPVATSMVASFAFRVPSWHP